MRPAAWTTLLLIAPLALASFATGVTGPLANDAGSGRDAPDTIGEALANPLIVPTNVLLEGYTDFWLDAADVYGFHVLAGQTIAIDASGPVGCLQVYRPDGSEQAHDAACSIAHADLGLLSVVADVSGVWFVDYSYLQPQTYRFTIGIDARGPSPYLVPPVLGATGNEVKLPPVAPASKSGDHVVIAVVDTGINPYHDFFRAAALDSHPSTWLAGFPSDATSVSLSLNAASYADALAADGATWASLEAGRLYTFPGTRVVGAYSFSQYSDPLVGTGTIAVLDEHGHGTHSAGLAAGANLAASDGNVLIVMVEVAAGDFGRGVAWAASQPWIDAISLSAGSRANVPAGGSGLAAGLAAAEASGKPFLVASGNGVSGTGVAPDHCSTHTSPYTGPLWATRIGAADPASNNPTWWHCVPVDAVARTNVISPDAGSITDASTATGTSAATPNAAGAFAHLLLEARRQNLPEDRPAVLQHLLNASQPAPTQVAWGAEPSTSATAPFDQGYGLIDKATLTRALATLPTGTPTPRPELDAWWEADRAIRAMLWGGGSAPGVQQNDAGSGRDAPDTLSDDVRVSPGVVYHGMLTGVLADGADVYAFDVTAGQRIRTISTGALHCSYLVDPAGVERDFGCSLTPALPSATDIVADATGTWYLRVSYIQPELYGFAIGLDAEPPAPLPV